MYGHAETMLVADRLINEGLDAFNAGKTREDNPYPAGERLVIDGISAAAHELWNQGFRRGERATRRP
jgi:hypothetical protein